MKLRSIIVAMKGGGEERGRVSGVVCKMRGWQKKKLFGVKFLSPNFGGCAMRSRV